MKWLLYYWIFVTFLAAIGYLKFEVDGKNHRIVAMIFAIPISIIAWSMTIIGWFVLLVLSIKERRIITHARWEREEPKC